MYIERIIISGFKSYREHTVIDGFDRYFNAITGPNGSGKSNILDAICFVLGIQNLTLVRASNGLQDLIYKQGQTGVTKASVEIVFNNEDKQNSPVGYEQFDHISVCRQITSGSASKYFINDHAANATRVHNLFHSVQLNVNNPHFLIMQGKITQVLNMKPREILGLIEEAAGIKMFEDKKEESKRTLERKQKQLDEIERIFKEELEPNLERLRQERKDYEEWSALRGEVDRLQKWVIAFEYKDTEIRLKEGIQLYDQAQIEKKELEQSIEQLDEDIVVKQTQIKEITQKESSEKGEYTNLEKKIKDINNEITKNDTKIRQSKSEIKKLEKNKKSAQDQIPKMQESLKKKEQEIELIKNANAEIERKIEDANNEVQQIESRIKNVNIGISDEGQKVSLSDEIEEKKKIILDCQAEIKKIKNNKPYLTDRRTELESQKRDAENELVELDRSIDNCQNELQSIRRRLEELNFDPKYEEDLYNSQERLHQEISRKKDDLNLLDRELGFLLFRPTIPHGVSEKNIHGPLVKLFHVANEYNDDFNFALQKAAGGKLFNIVVDNENVSDLLIHHGHLKKRYTFIPLNKIDKSILPKETLNNAKREAGHEAFFAFDMIEFNAKYDPAMRYAFGKTFICTNKEVAVKLAYGRSKIRSVTQVGSVYDPHGVVSGGFTEDSDTRKTVIYKVRMKRDLKASLHNHEQELIDVTTKLGNMQQDSQEYKNLINMEDMAEHQLQKQIERKRMSTYEEAARNLDKVNQEIENNKARKRQCKDMIREAENRINELTAELTKWSMQKEERIKSLEMELKKVQVAYDSLKKEKIAKESDLVQYELDLKSTLEEIETAEKEIEKIDESIEKVKSEIEKFTEKVGQLTKELETNQKAFDELKAGIAQAKNQLSICIREETELEKQKTDKQKKLKKVLDDIESSQTRQSELEKYINHLEKEYAWIEREKRFFGVSQTPFDPKLYNGDLQYAKDLLQEQLDKQQELEQTVNKKVISQCDRAENEYESLVEKKKNVENEKLKIEQVIEQLDEKKREAITSTHRKVTEDLQEIVGQILPGTKAELIPPENSTVFEGLELTVAFNNLHKSLTELSGGQSSLIALGLVLALLKFKPAPVYILDEVDAALDLNNTQNIGKMLRKSFQKAQFIVVSLKEGLWNNANVVFRTSFRDENSHVQKTENVQK